MAIESLKIVGKVEKHGEDCPYTENIEVSARLRSGAGTDPHDFQDHTWVEFSYWNMKEPLLIDVKDLEMILRLGK